MNYRIVWLITIIGLSGWLAACASLRSIQKSGDPNDAPTPPSTTVSPELYPSPLAGTEWLLIVLNGHPPFSYTYTQINISFSEDGFGGRDGCNNYWGFYAVDAENNFFIVPGPDGISFARTIMGCEIICDGDEDIPCDEKVFSKQEDAYHEALFSAASFHLETGRLEMRDSDGQTRLVFVPLGPEVRRPILESRTWRLVHIVDGETTVLPLAGTEITLQFVRSSEQGVMRGTLGCNNYRALYNRPAGGLEFVWFRITDEECDEPEGVMEFETYVLNLLTRMSALIYDDQQLWLQTREGQELFFRR